MIFEIDFNKTGHYNDKFLKERLGAYEVDTGSNKYPPFEKLCINIDNFDKLEELLKIVDKEFKDYYSAIVTFGPPAIYLDNKI